MPTVSYDNPNYSTNYWRGPTWLNVAYFAAKGLKNYHFDDTADKIRIPFLNGWKVTVTKFTKIITQKPAKENVQSILAGVRYL